jgi:drug/metabolite transporter (DMT)-like permease
VTSVGGTGVPRPDAGLISVFAGFLLFSTSPALVAGSAIVGLVLALWRAWISAAVFGGVVWARGRSTAGIMTLTVLPGIAFGGATALFFEAAQRTSVANAAMIAAMQPVPMLFAARVVFGERVTRVDLMWVALALTGAVIMVTSAAGGTASLSGDLIGAVSSLFGAAYFVTSRMARNKGLEALPLMAGAMFWSSVLLTPIVLLSANGLETPTGGEWIRLAAIALVPGLGHVLIAYSQRTVPFVVVGLAQLLMPVGAGLLAWLFLDQSIGSRQLAGMALVLVSLAAHTLYRAKLTATEESPVGVAEAS